MRKIARLNKIARKASEGLLETEMFRAMEELYHIIDMCLEAFFPKRIIQDNEWKD